MQLQFVLNIISIWLSTSQLHVPVMSWTDHRHAGVHSSTAGHRVYAFTGMVASDSAEEWEQDQSTAEHCDCLVKATEEEHIYIPSS